LWALQHPAGMQVCIRWRQAWIFFACSWCFRYFSQRSSA
jgi:hypothetical protein